MVAPGFSQHVLSFDAKSHFLDVALGSVMEEKDYTALLEKECPKLRSRDAEVQRLYKSAFEGLEGWKTGEGGLIDKIFNKITFKTPKEKISAANPYAFPPVDEVEKETLAKKASFHQTVAKVMLIVGAIFLFTGILGPFALLPALLSMGVGAASTTVMVATGIGTLGTAGILASIFLKNTESIRIHRMKTDPDFKVFVDKVIQHKKRVNLNATEEDLKDKAVHTAYLDWKDNMQPLFTDPKREKVTLELERVRALFARQPELVAEGLLKLHAKKHPKVTIPEEVKQQAKEKFIARFTPLLNTFTQALFTENGYKSDQEIDAFFTREQAMFNEILKAELSPT
ncbi:hypothetical protein [Estrella lausannensis]|uniref:Conserved putative membrane protein n=1 Tax=Estrella lausannensis TaxID=483423 RepID=A0A0H5DPC0_9BACT|nr:hypothetical protein [Estrella lausannensis]CRX38381.1 Conserved putative membrane protein [Estrella lausannensis]